MLYFYQLTLDIPASSSNRIIDDSTNAHVLRDKSLFISNIKPFLIRTDAGILIDSNKLKLNGMTMKTISTKHFCATLYTSWIH